MAYEHKVKPLPYAYDKLKGISEQTNKNHHDVHYAAYVDGRNKVEAALEKCRSSGDWSAIRGIKTNESHNTSGQVLHEMFWDVLGGDGKFDENLEVIQKINEDFGSFDNFKAEFTEVAKVARGWSLLNYGPGDTRLHVHMVDNQDGFAIWGAQPVLGVDVWEHAYYLDYGPKRALYIEAFWNNIDWRAVNEKFLQLK